MSKLIQLTDENGIVLNFETPSPPGELEIEAVSRSGQIIEHIGAKLETVVANAKPVAEAIYSSLSNLSHRPSEIEVSFGLKLTAQVGLVVTSGDIEANYVVKLKWIHKENSNERS